MAESTIAAARDDVRGRRVAVLALSFFLRSLRSPTRNLVKAAWAPGARGRFVHQRTAQPPHAVPLLPPRAWAMYVIRACCPRRLIAR